MSGLLPRLKSLQVQPTWIIPCARDGVIRQTAGHCSPPQIEATQVGLEGVS